MSAPITKSQMAFELPRLSYIDTHLEEPVARVDAGVTRKTGLGTWLAARLAAFGEWNARARSLRELNVMTDRELFDVGLNRGDFDRLFDDRLNQDLRSRGRTF